METSERRVEGERVSVNHLKSDTGSDPEDVTTHELSVDAGRTFDQARAEAAVRELLIAVGEDPDREGLRDTPARVARAYREVFGGLFTDPDEVLDTTFDEGHQELVLVRDIPMYSPERRYRKLLGSLALATASGITTVVEPQVPLAEVGLFDRAREAGLLSSRVIAALFHPIDADAVFRRDLREAVDGAAVDDRLRFGPVKLYADDVIEPHTAWMLDDYANRPGHRGHPSAPVGELARIVTELDRLGFQTHTHATGDGGIRLALDAIETAARANGTRDRRHGIVHVECLHPDDLGRFAALGVTAAMQPRHCSPDLVAGTWMDNIGEQRWDRAWRIGSLMASGAHVALSSDWQVGEMDPLVGLYSALTRAGLDGRDAWTPAERIGLDDAIRGYTREGAWAWHAEDELGGLRVGAKADLVAWSDDLYEHEGDPAALLDQRAALTVVGGEVVHDADRDAPAPEQFGALAHCSAAEH